MVRISAESRWVQIRQMGVYFLGQPELLKFALNRQISRLGCKREIESAQVIASWATVVGPQVAARAQVDSLRDGKLTLVVPDSAWMQELEASSIDLIQRLNDHAGRTVVREIYFAATARKKD